MVGRRKGIPLRPRPNAQRNLFRKNAPGAPTRLPCRHRAGQFESESLPGCEVTSLVDLHSDPTPCIIAGAAEMGRSIYSASDRQIGPNARCALPDMENFTWRCLVGAPCRDGA